MDTVVSLARPAALDADAFAELYRAQINPVLNYCLFRVGNRLVAEDLTADAFERAWRARRRYRPERAAFSTWLFAIAGRVVVDWQRRQRRRPVITLDERFPDQSLTPEAEVEQMARRERLRQLVLALSEWERELVALKFGAGMTNRQIAVLLGKSETAVGSAVHRAVRKLRVQWEVASA